LLLVAVAVVPILIWYLVAGTAAMIGPR